jgi:Ca-activated chloride channel family protein
VIDGILKEREQARADYDLAISQGQRAAIAEEERPDVFTMRAGNIMPGEAITVELELSGPLALSDGEATYRFPLVVAPRYIPGVALDGESVGSGTALDTDAVPDASRISPPILLPGMPNPVHFTLSLELDSAGLPVRNLRASLHELEIEDLSEGVRRVGLTPGATRLDRDFILRFEVGEESVATSFRSLPDSDGPGCTVALTVVPPNLKRCGVKPRDVVVVLDRSGSMQGWKMVAARRAAARILDSLTDKDRLALILFDSVLEEPLEGSGKLLEATDRNRFQAVEFLARVEARGGTEIGPALARSLEYFARPQQGREQVVVFVTDGQVGNEAQVYEHVARHAGKTRIYTVGVDRAVNESFLKRLAESSGGVFDLVESEDRLDEVMRSIHRRIGSPVLRDLQLHLDGLSEVTPEKVDVFPGMPAVISGRLAGPAPDSVRVTATRADGKPFQAKLGHQPTFDPVLRHVWARARVLDLEHRFDTDAGPLGLGQTITDFSLKWGVLCRFTAYVAVDASGVVNPSGRVHQVTQAVEAPSQWGTDMGRGTRMSRAMAEAVYGYRSPAPAAPCRPGAPGPLDSGWLGAGSGACFDALSSIEGGASPQSIEANVPDRKRTSKPAPSPEEWLRKTFSSLEKAIESLKQEPKPLDSIDQIEEALVTLARWASEPARKLEASGREALESYRRDPAEGLPKLQAWLEELRQLLGLKPPRKKSWWKR